MQLAGLRKPLASTMEVRFKIPSSTGPQSVFVEISYDLMIFPAVFPSLFGVDDARGPVSSFSAGTLQQVSPDMPCGGSTSKGQHGAPSLQRMEVSGDNS